MNTDLHDRLDLAASQVREDVNRLVDGFDVQKVSKKIEDLGRENPLGLALTALALGVAVGLLMRGAEGFGIETE